MSDETIEFLPYDEAVKIVGAIQEEEDVHDQNHRILTVYDHDDRELCWFDFQETLEAVGEVPAGEKKESVQKYILHHIPTWVGQK